MKRLYFARHGEGTHMTTGVWVSKSDHQLTPLGRKQAKSEGKKAKEMGLKFDLIISSPIMRAHQTAKIIAQEVGYPISKIELNDLFVERGYGDMEGATVAAVMRLGRENMDSIPNVEKLDQLHLRAQRAHDYILSLQQNSILVVAHSGFGRALRRVILKQPHTHEYIEHTSIPPAEIVCWIEE